MLTRSAGRCTNAPPTAVTRWDLANKKSRRKHDCCASADVHALLFCPDVALRDGVRKHSLLQDASGRLHRKAHRRVGHAKRIHLSPGRTESPQVQAEGWSRDS